MLMNMWKNVASVGAISIERDCNAVTGISSGPAAFWAVTAVSMVSSFSIPCKSTDNGEMCGQPVPSTFPPGAWGSLSEH